MFLKKLFLRIFAPEWTLIDVITGVTGITKACQLPDTKKVTIYEKSWLVHYNIYHSIPLNKFKVVTKGKGAKNLPLYSTVLKLANAIEITEELEDSIAIWSFPLNNQAKDIFSLKEKNEVLIKAINDYKKTLERENVTIFEQQDNIIATDKGYFGAFKRDQLPFNLKNYTDKDEEEQL